MTRTYFGRARDVNPKYLNEAKFRKDIFKSVSSVEPIDINCDEIENQEIQLGSIKLPKPSSLQFNRLAGFVVYGWRRKAKYLYIGYSKSLYNRLANHHVIGRLAKVEHDDELDIWQCSDMIEARAIEKLLVTELNPPLNAAIKRGSKRSIRRDNRSDNAPNQV